MIDTKIVLALTLLIGSLTVIENKPPAGGVPIPQHGAGFSSAR